MVIIGITSYCGRPGYSRLYIVVESAVPSAYQHFLKQILIFFVAYRIIIIINTLLLCYMGTLANSFFVFNEYYSFYIKISKLTKLQYTK